MTQEEESFSGLIEALTKHGEVMVRSFEKNRTLVEQGSQNDCFYRLLSGKVRFEKRILEENIVVSVALLGTMDVSAKWRYFCELSAFGIQEKTSAAVVAESDVKVLVIPVDVFNEVIERNSSWKTQFFQSITKRLAELLRSLHTRTISLSSLNITASGQQIHNEVVRFSWACTTKAGVSKINGQLLLSRNYVAFLRQKDNDRKGVVADAANCGKTVIRLTELSEITLLPKRTKLTLRNGSAKISVTFKKEQDTQVVRDVLSTAKIASQRQRCVSPSKQVKEQRLVICTQCQDHFCSYCQLLNQMKNPCASGQRHVFSIERTVYCSDNTCGRCGNAGTHILIPSDLQSLLDKFQTQFYSENTIIQKVGTNVERIGYILDGSVSVKVINEAGEELKLNDVVSGETIGDIGVFMGTNSSAELSAGVGGCNLLNIPKCYLVDESESDFRARVCFSLIQLMWDRITRQETVQLEIWTKKMLHKDERFLEDVLLREQTGKNIDERGKEGWY